MDTKKLSDLNDKYIAYVQETIDMTVQGAEDEFPVMGDVIARSGVATHKQLDVLEAQGHIKSVTIDVPSRLMPGKTVPAKAYYTERRVPKLVDAMLPKKQTIEIVK
jgi:hypothetical protein